MTADNAFVNVLILDDERSHGELLGDHLQRRGYQTALAGTISEAEALARGGVDVAVVDIRGFPSERAGHLDKDESAAPKPDHFGLTCIKKLLALNPNLVVIVCSQVAAAFEAWARQLGAHEVINKREDLSVTAIDVENAILRHTGRKDYDRLRRISFFVGAWFIAPLFVAAAGALAFWKMGSTRFLSQIDLACLPIAAGLLFILTFSSWIGNRDPVIQAWRPFLRFRLVALWILTAIAAGLFFEVLLKLPPLRALAKLLEYF